MVRRLESISVSQETADFASSQKEDQATFQANIALQKALANAGVSQSTALDAAALDQEQADSTALQDFEDGSNAAVEQAEGQMITANQTWVTTVVQATAAALVQDSGFDPATSNLVAAWETFELSAVGSWVTSMTGQAAADEAQGDAQDHADKTASDEIAGASVAADAAMNTAGLTWLADEIKLAKTEFKAFQQADKSDATAAIAADKKQTYADSDAAHTANLNSAIAAQKADAAAIQAQYDLTIDVDEIEEIDYEADLDAAFDATVADEGAVKSLITGIASLALAAADSDAGARAGQVASIAAADAQVAVAAAKKAAATNYQTSADNLANLQAQPASYFGALATSVPQKTPNAFWEWVITMPGLDPAANFFYGMGDSLTFGGTKAVRQGMNVDFANYDSGAYMGGSITGQVIGAVIAGGAGGCGRATSLAQAIAKVYSKIDTGMQLGGVLMKWAGGDFSVSDLLVVASAAGILRGGCFVVDTPVAVGWNYEPITVDQAFQPGIGVDQASEPDSRDENGTINVGWMIAGIGIVATTVYLRNKRDEEDERQKQLSRRLIFANGKFVSDLEEDDADEPFPPLARGGQGGSRGTVMEEEFPAILPSPLAGEGPGVG